MMAKIWVDNQLETDNNLKIVNFITSKVMMTVHGRFPFNIEQDK